MGTPSYVNPVTPQEVSLALEHFLIAPAGTNWSPARVDLDAPPSGFIHLGAVADDSPTVTASKQTYDLVTGIPGILQYQAVTGMQGQLGMALHTYDPYAMYLASGGLPPYLMPKTSASVYGITSAGSSRGTVYVSSTATATFAANDLVVSDTTPALNTSRNYAWITAATSVAAGTGVAWTLTLQGTGLPFTPTAGNPIVSVAYAQEAVGTNILPEFTVLGVADALNGMQIVHYARKARPTGDWAAQLRPASHMITPVTMNLLGYSVSTPYSSSGQLIVLEAFTFMPTTIQ